MEKPNPFTIEQLEYIRIVMGERNTILKGRAKGFQNDKNVSEERKSELIDENSHEQGLTAIIEAIAMREISNSVLSDEKENRDL